MIWLAAVNRVIKKLRNIKTKLPPPHFCMNGLTIMIGQLELVWLNNRKTGRKHVHKLISRRLLIFINILSANSFVYILFSSLPIGQLKTKLTNHNCKAVHTKLEG